MKKSKSFFVKFLIFCGISAVAVFSLLAANNTTDLDVSGAEKPGYITVDFKDAEIGSVLRVLSAKSGVNIVAGKDVTGLITIRLVDVPWEKALDVILRTYGYAYEREGNIIRVTTVENLAKEELVTQVFSLNYAKAEEVSKAVEEMLSERGKIKFDERTNLIIVTDIPTNIYKIEQVIKNLDSQTPQVEIEAKIIEITLGKDEKLGIDWQTKIVARGAKRPTIAPFSTWGSHGRMYPRPDSTMTYSGGTVTSVTSDFDIRGGLPANHAEDVHFSSFPMADGDVGADEFFNFGTLDFTGFQATMEFLLSRTDTEVLSNPRITTLNNKEARITVGTKWPVAQYTYSDEASAWHISGWEYIEYGILLNVTPVINKDGYITLKVKPEISEAGGTVSFEGATVPIITTKEAEASVMIKDGETLVIGGLMKDKITDTKRKIPILGDIPIVGLLFSKKEKTVEKRELLIFLTSKIIKNMDNAGTKEQALAQNRNFSQTNQALKEKNYLDAQNANKQNNKGYLLEEE